MDDIYRFNYKMFAVHIYRDKLLKMYTFVLILYYIYSYYNLIAAFCKRTLCFKYCLNRAETVPYGIYMFAYFLIILHK